MNEWSFYKWSFGFDSCGSAISCKFTYKTWIYLVLVHLYLPLGCMLNAVVYRQNSHLLCKIYLWMIKAYLYCYRFLYTIIVKTNFCTRLSSSIGNGKIAYSFFPVHIHGKLLFWFLLLGFTYSLKRSSMDVKCKTFEQQGFLARTIFYLESLIQSISLFLQECKEIKQ